MPLIDWERLEYLYHNDLIYALQLEINDECFQGCEYCYMNAPTIRKGRLPSKILNQIIAEAADMGVYCIEWLGGEPLLREDVFDLMEFADHRGLRNNMWTGGLPLENYSIAEKCVELTQNGLISFHLSTLNPQSYAASHPERPPEDMYAVIKGVENCLKAGKPPELMINSTTFTSHYTAEELIEVIKHFQKEYNIPSCVNVYQFYEPRSGENIEQVLRFMPDIKSIKKVLNFLQKTPGNVSQGANCVTKQYCSATAAVLNDGRLTPCATIRPENAPSILENGLKTEFEKHRDWLIIKKLKNPENLPQGCQTCKLNDGCWGCRAKSWDHFHNIYQRDSACFRNPYNYKK